MFKLIHLKVLAIVIVMISGCSSKDTENENIKSTWDFQSGGYVVEKTDGKVLVTRDKPTKTSISDILKEADPNAMWITVINNADYDAVQVGDEVNIDIPDNTIIDQSFPSQVKANISKK